MKTKTNKMKAMFALFALLTVTVVLAIAAAPAMAGKPYADSSMVREAMGTFELDKVHQVLDTVFPDGIIAEAEHMPVPDEGPFPDGGGWEPVFPEDDEDEVAPDDSAEDTADEADDADDEAIEEPVDESTDETGGDTCTEETADDGSDDAGDQTNDEPVDEAGDETVEDEPEDDVVEEEESQQEEPLEENDEAVELPFTGGNSTPWLIAGAAVIFAGASMLFRRRNRNENR